MMGSIFDPQYWNLIWQEHDQSHRASEGEVGKEQGEIWNKKAKKFAADNLGKSGSKRCQQTLSFITQTMALRPKMKVLDIGCGPGTFAIPLAQMGLEVTALDPADQMLKQMTANLPADLPGKIIPVLGAWEELDPEEKGWTEQFDLVFASMSPGIFNQQMLEQMNACSKGWCFLSNFAGPRYSPLFDEFWQEVFAAPLSNHRFDMVFAFNSLYMMGYSPYVSYYHVDSEKWAGRDEFTAELSSLIKWSPMKLEKENLEDRIDQFLESRMVDGKIQQHWRYTVGMLLWNVNHLRKVI